MLNVTTWTLAGSRRSKEGDGKPILAVNFGGHEAKIADFDFAEDGKKLFTLGEDNTIQIWDATTHEL